MNLVDLALAVALGAVVLQLRPSPEPAAVAAKPPRHAPAEARPTATPSPIETGSPWPEAAPPEPRAGPGPGDEAALATVARLRRLVRDNAPLDAGQVEAAEALVARNPEDAAARGVLESVLLTAAEQALPERPRDAVAWAHRLCELRPDASPHDLLARAYLAAKDWRASERACRDAIAIDPRDALAYGLLGEALMMQDRDEEAAAALRRSLALREDTALRSKLAWIERDLGFEKGMARSEASHFRLRFEGEPRNDVAEAILEILERRYAELARTLDCEPAQPIPVILYAGPAAIRAAGGPNWAGAIYSHEGRIRVNVGDLSARSGADLEKTLTHELTHAFVAARTRGVVPRNVNEGLAEYMAGRRAGPIDRARAAAMVRGEAVEVYFSYEAATSFVEFLIGRYRQTAMNDLLQALGETRDFDRAFGRAYRLSYAEAYEEWLKQLPLAH